MRGTNMRCLAMFFGVGVLLAGSATQEALGQKQVPIGGCDPDCNLNGIPDPCDLDCDGTGTSGPFAPCLLWFCGAFPACEQSSDCNGDSIPDDCQLAGNDCNGNFIPDDCEPKVACCSSGDTCSFVPSDCCSLPTGASAGPGTTCAGVDCEDAGLACCKADHVDEFNLVPWCDNHTIFNCAVHGGTPLSTMLSCSNLMVIADRDGDEVINDCDICPDNPDVLQLESDGDGLGDACENCPGVYNPDQDDCDDDGEGDCCSSDYDGDGVNNGIDVCPFNHPDNIVDPVTGRPQGDFNEDCVVDAEDQAVFDINRSAPAPCTDSTGDCSP